MSKTGRNDPCPCGSGEKYKRCCLQKDEAARDAQREAVNARLQARDEGRQAALAAQADQYRDYLQASASVAQLIEAGQFDAAEAAARDLIVRFPEVPDGYDRMGLLCEARGDHRQAAYWYREVIAFMRAHPEHYSAKDQVVFQRMIDRLDPVSTAP